MRRAGADELGEEEFVRQASLDLHWFSPKQGRRFLEAAEALGYLVPGSRPHTVRTAFPPADLEVPMDFRLTPDDLVDLPAAAEATGVAEELVELACRARGWEADRAWAEVRRKEEALFETPVAALLVAAEAGVAVRPFVGRVRRELARRSVTSSASGSGRRS